MLVSVVIPAYRAEATIARCVASLQAQTHPDWEAVVVADDRQDYTAILAAAGIADGRLRFVATGAVGSGCHNARNVGLSAARGDLVAPLDADDLYDPGRLAALAPLAMAHGAVVDCVAVISEADGRTLYTAPSAAVGNRLAVEALLDLSVPLFPVVLREFAAPRIAGVEYGEDVIANLGLIERLGSLPVFPRALYRYHVVPGSLCHDDNSGAAFDAAYSAYLARLNAGDGFGLVANRAAALRGLADKREVNRRYIAARLRQPELTFQDFMAPYRGSVAWALGRPAPAKAPGAGAAASAAI